MTTAGDIDSALKVVRGRDAEAGRNAEGALSALTAGEGFDHVNQHFLQYFLWYTLPKKFLTSLDAKLDTARALGEVLEAAGMPRYAAICRSDTTRECIEAAEDYGRGRKEYERAQASSGVEPPDTDVLEWGSIMGMSEAAANTGAASALELAISAGDLEPGASGWKKVQKKLASVWLEAPSTNFDGDTPLAAIHAERMAWWVRGRSQARGALLEPLLPRLVGNSEVPEGAEDALAPFTWFLTRAVEGIPLTEKHNLGRDFVRESAGRWNWWELPGQPMREDDVVALWVLHEFAIARKLVRRRGRKLFATPAARRGLQDTKELWRTVACGLVAEGGFFDAVVELTLAVLILEGETKTDDIVTTITTMLAEEGWGMASQLETRASVDERDVDSVMRELRHLAKPFGLIVEKGDWRSRSLALTDVGQGTALEALRARATAPRFDVY